MLSDNSTIASVVGVNGTFSLLEDPRFITLLKVKGKGSRGMEEALRVLEEWRTQYNISVVKECVRSQYCSGDLRDLILAYNSLHGYVSLLVSPNVVFSISTIVFSCFFLISAPHPYKVRKHSEKMPLTAHQ